MGIMLCLGVLAIMNITIMMTGRGAGQRRGLLPSLRRLCAEICSPAIWGVARPKGPRLNYSSHGQSFDRVILSLFPYLYVV